MDGSILTKTGELRHSEMHCSVKKSCIDFVPTHASAEAQICLNCPYPKCKPDTCKRIREERKKLKEQQNER